MRSKVVTLPERLKTSGYTTGISGKWHLDVEGRGKEGDETKLRNRDLLPHRQGFNEYFTGTMQDYTASHALDGMPYYLVSAPIDLNGGDRVDLFVCTRPGKPRDTHALRPSVVGCPRASDAQIRVGQVDLPNNAPTLIQGMRVQSALGSFLHQDARRLAVDMI